jgi:hypothetical protein
MKKKDINIIMAAVTVLVMFKTMINRAFNEEAADEFEEEDEDEPIPFQVADEEYEYFNELLEAIDFDNLTEDDLDNIELEDLLQGFSDSLEFKLALMKNSSLLKAMLSNKTTSDYDDVEGEAVTDI